MSQELWNREELESAIDLPGVVCVDVDHNNERIMGRIVLSGNNPYIVVKLPRGQIEWRVSYGALCEVLNDTRGVEYLPIPAKPDKRYATPVSVSL